MLNGGDDGMFDCLRLPTMFALGAFLHFPLVQWVVEEGAVEAKARVKLDDRRRITTKSRGRSR